MVYQVGILKFHSFTLAQSLAKYNYSGKKEGTFIFLFRKKKGGKHPKKQESGHSCTNIQSKMFMGISSSHAHTSSRKINDRGAEQVGFFFPEQGA